MKRSCETCLWWDEEHGEPDTDGRILPQACRNPDAMGVSRRASSWCSKWEPRDRSLVRCETCEWWRCTASKVDEHTLGFCQYRPRADERWPETYSIDYCAHWRLQED